MHNRTDATTKTVPVKYKHPPFIPWSGVLLISLCFALVVYVFFGSSHARGTGQEQAAMIQCARLYSDPQFNELTFGMTEEKQLCRRRLPFFRSMVQTDYRITGSALRLTDSTHSLIGLSVARSKAGSDRRAAPELTAVAVFSDHKFVATLQFGDPQSADKAFNQLSDAIASAQMLQILATKGNQ